MSDGTRQDGIENAGNGGASVDPAMQQGAGISGQQDPQAGVGQVQAAPTPQGAQGELGLSGLAVAALVLGIVGTATSFMPIINNASFVMGILGLIFAIVGILGINKGKKRGRGIAIAGLVLSIVSLVAVLATQSLYGAVLDEVQENISETTNTSGTISQQAQEEAESPYEVTIDSATKTTDYEGKPAVIVTYTWTNGSDSDTSFVVALSARCFQDGVQCETAIVSGLGGDALKQLKPGASATVQQAYLLDGSSPITIEVSETFSLDDVVLASATFDSI